MRTRFRGIRVLRIRFRQLIAAALLITLPGLSHAVVIADVTSDGLGVDLGGLQWLEISLSSDFSRDDIEGMLGTFAGGGWRYATRSEAETLFESLGDAGWSAGNLPGVEWFRSAFDVAVPSEQTVRLYYGDDGECDADPANSCYSQLRIDGAEALIQYGTVADKFGAGNTVASLLVQSVPAPAALLLMLAGLGGLFASRRLA